MSAKTRLLPNEMTDQQLIDWLRPLPTTVTILSMDAGMIRELIDRFEVAREALWRIKQWSEAYPTKIFPKPDLIKARALLEGGGMTLDSISAHCMRDAVDGVGKIARDALSLTGLLPQE